MGCDMSKGTELLGKLPIPGNTNESEILDVVAAIENEKKVNIKKIKNFQLTENKNTDNTINKVYTLEFEDDKGETQHCELMKDSKGTFVIQKCEVLSGGKKGTEEKVDTKVVAKAEGTS